MQSAKSHSNRHVHQPICIDFLFFPDVPEFSPLQLHIAFGPNPPIGLIVKKTLLCHTSECQGKQNTFVDEFDGMFGFVQCILFAANQGWHFIIW